MRSVYSLVDNYAVKHRTAHRLHQLGFYVLAFNWPVSTAIQIYLIFLFHLKLFALDVFGTYISKFPEHLHEILLLVTAKSDALRRYLNSCIINRSRPISGQLKLV